MVSRRLTAVFISLSGGIACLKDILEDFLVLFCLLLAWLLFWSPEQFNSHGISF